MRAGMDMVGDDVFGGMGEDEHVLDGVEEAGLVGSEEAVGADFDEASGEDVLEEGVNEVEGVEGFELPTVGLGVFEFEGDETSVQAEDAVVGKSDAGDIGSEVLDHFKARACG
jgi:hypothetical protein